MRLLITGGAGYLGSVLVPGLLHSGHEVHVLDQLQHGGRSLLGVWSQPGFRFIRGNICDSELVRSCLKGLDGVVHLAAIVGDPACARKPDDARAVNLRASLDLLEECRRYNVHRFVFASTCSNYGRMTDPNAILAEESQLRPISLYAETKVAVESAILQSSPDAVFCPTILRFATLFGTSPRMRFDLTVNEFTRDLVVRKKLSVYGEQFWRPYVHVRDAARAICAVLENPNETLLRCQVYNVGSTDENYQKRDIVGILRRFVTDGEIEYIHRNEDPRDYKVSFEKIKHSLDFKITRTVEQGIPEIISVLQSGVIADPFAPEFSNTP